MSTLHIIRRLESSHSSITNSIALLAEGDAVVLIDDGTYNINNMIYKNICKVIPSDNIHVIAKHAQARGLAIPGNISAITMKELLDLSLSTTQSITWQ
jgi:tRNA 2-thiouridine synthesizing protein B